MIVVRLDRGVRPSRPGVSATLSSLLGAGLADTSGHAQSPPRRSPDRAPPGRRHSALRACPRRGPAAPRRLRDSCRRRWRRRRPRQARLGRNRCPSRFAREWRRSTRHRRCSGCRSRAPDSRRRVRAERRTVASRSRSRQWSRAAQPFASLLLQRRLDRLMVGERNDGCADGLPGLVALAGNKQHIALCRAWRPPR